MTIDVHHPPWLERALDELGVEEIPGDADNPRIVEYHAATTLRASDDEVPWCSSFVNWCMRDIFPTTGSARARSWLAWGIPIAYPAAGCVAILARGGGNQPGPKVLDAQGHVGFFVGFDLGGEEQIEPLVTVVAGQVIGDVDV